MTASSHRGTLADGAPYRLESPERWNGRLILYSHGPPVQADAPYFPDSPLVTSFLARGYAVAGWATTVFWHLEDAFRRQPLVLEEAQRILGVPERTIAYGQSIGGIISAGLAQVHPERLAGALAVCGPLAGGIATKNRELDIEFVVKTLLAPADDLDVARIRDPQSNLRAALAVLTRAKTTVEGRARLALAAAIAEVPGRPDAISPEPRGVDELVDAQIAWFERIVFLVIFSARAVVEGRAGGNPSWNTGVDYRVLFERSSYADAVRELYQSAALDLDEDLDTIDRAERISADPAAVEYMERYITFDGDLRVPVVTMHTTGDGLCTPSHEHAYREAVRAASREDMLRQLWIDRGGHCTFSTAETQVALDVLEARLDGRWPETTPPALRSAAAALGRDASAAALGGAERNAGAVVHGNVGALAAAFTAFEPPPFSRPHDRRHTAPTARASASAADRGTR